MRATAASSSSLGAHAACLLRALSRLLLLPLTRETDYDDRRTLQEKYQASTSELQLMEGSQMCRRSDHNRSHRQQAASPHLMGLTRHWPLGESHCLNGSTAHAPLFLLMPGAAEAAASSWMPCHAWVHNCLRLLTFFCLHKVQYRLPQVISLYR